MGTLVSKGLMLRIVMIIICALVSGINNIYVATAITFILFAGYVIFMYAEGAQVGEEQCTMTDTVRRIRDQGGTPTQKQLGKCFDPKHGIIACAILAAPGLIIAVLNLITADPAQAAQGVIGVIARIYFLPEVFLTRICTELVKTDISGSIAAAAVPVKAISKGTLDVESLIKNTAGLNGAYTVMTDYSPIKILNILYVPISLIPPVAMLIGFMRGPKLRAKVLNDMMSGSNKKLRRMKKKKTLQPRTQKPEI